MTVAKQIRDVEYNSIYIIGKPVFPQIGSESDAKRNGSAMESSAYCKLGEAVCGTNFEPLCDYIASRSVFCGAKKLGISFHKLHWLFFFPHLSELL
jgi:hypothetical protein